MKCSKPTKKQPRRNAVAAAEFAVCLPVVALIVLATIEACTMVFLKQSLEIAAYEGARTAIALNTSPEDVENSANQILNERRVQGGVVTITPAGMAGLDEGEYVVVEVSAPAASNSIVPITFYQGRTITGQATMMKEF